MQIRFETPDSREAAREDGMTVHYAPAKRPRLRHGVWYFLLACLSLILMSAVLAATGASLCH